MLKDFGDAISAVFDLEFSQVTDKFLSGMKRFNGMAGAIAGWFTIASVLIGAALGALGFAFGPAGVATVGAGAAAGLEFAESVGIGLLIIALSTEAAVIAKAYFDLRFQNPRIKDEAKLTEADQTACKAIAGSTISVVTIGALVLLGAVAVKFAKFLWSLVEDVPIIRDVAAMLKNAKEAVGDLGLRKKPGAAGEPVPEGRAGPGETPVDAEPAARPEERRATEPADRIPDDTAAKAEAKGVPRERLQAEANELRQKASNPDNVRRPKEQGHDAEMDADGHNFDRSESDRTWCRHSEGEACGLNLGGDLNTKVDAALKEKPPEPAKGTPEEPAGAAAGAADYQARLKRLEDNYGRILEQDLDLKLKLKKLQMDLADPATSSDAAARFREIESDLVESAIAELEKKAGIDPTKIDQLREHLREHPEDLNKALDRTPDDFGPPADETPRDPARPEVPESERMRRIKNGELIDVTDFVNESGRKVNVDPDYRPPQDTKGRSNAERAEEGLAPILPDGQSVVLHHTNQDFFSPLDEHTQNFHESVLNDPDFHPMTGDPAYLSWRGEAAQYKGAIRSLGDIYDLIRARYWRRRFK